MRASRRALLGSALLAPAAVAAPPAGFAFGVQSFSYAYRLGRDPSLRDPAAFLKFCRERGAGGAQTNLPAGDPASAVRLRALQDETGCWLEGSVRLLSGPEDAERFENDVRFARDAGVSVLRTVMLGGRRYETFSTAEEYRRFKERAIRSITLAAAIVTRCRVRLAVENHKDFRSDEMVELMRGVSSEYVGITVDTGNNLALLERPMETIQALAPWVWAVHLKDMAVSEVPEGFQIAEVPFGEGMLDLRQIFRILRAARPQVRFSIEMATRDPLTVPCLTDKYHATFESLPASVLARMIAFVREKRAKAPLPSVEGLAAEERMKREDDNLRACLDYARRRLNEP